MGASNSRLTNTMRYHVEVMMKGRVVDIIGGFDDLDEATKGREKRENEQTADDNEADEAYIEALKASIFDRSDSDEEPRPRVRFHYAFRVAACTYGDKCAACLEAGVIVAP